MQVRAARSLAFNTEITEEDEVTEKKARPRAPGRIPPAAKPQRPKPPAPETHPRPSRFSVISSSSVISVLNRRLRRCHAAGTGRSNRAGRAGRGQATNVFRAGRQPVFLMFCADAGSVFAASGALRFLPIRPVLGASRKTPDTTNPIAIAPRSCEKSGLGRPRRSPFGGLADAGWRG